MANRAKGKFAGRRVLITGASSGIGEALARELARGGASLILTARREDRLHDLADELARIGAEAQVARCDVTRDGDLENAVAAAREKLGGLDIVIANAGFGVVGAIDELSLEDYRRQFETNVFGVLRTVKAALPELKRSKGTLVLMGSVAGHVSLPGASPYAMSKFAVRALAESLRHELKELGISVVLISPGYVKTEIHQVDNQGVFHADSESSRPDWMKMPAEQAAKQMASAIARRQAEKIVTFHGKTAVFLQRHTPWIVELAKSRRVGTRKEPKARAQAKSKSKD